MGQVIYNKGNALSLLFFALWRALSSCYINSMLAELRMGSASVDRCTDAVPECSYFLLQKDHMVGTCFSFWLM